MARETTNTDIFHVVHIYKKKKKIKFTSSKQ